MKNAPDGALHPGKRMNQQKKKNGGKKPWAYKRKPSPTPDTLFPVSPQDHIGALGLETEGGKKVFRNSEVYRSTTSQVSRKKRLTKAAQD